jgi:hypothetical protein
LFEKIDLPSVLLWHSAKKPSRAVYQTLGKAFFAECRGFAECFLFGSRQSLLCRAPEKKRSAKPPALGKEVDSGSGWYVYSILKWDNMWTITRLF